MSLVTRTSGVSHTVFGLALAGLAICSISSAKGGDLFVPGYGPYPHGAPYEVPYEAPHGALVERDGICRIFHERRIDAYGRESVHRIRLCDEGPIYSGPSWSVAPQGYGYPPRRYLEPSPSQLYSYPRPPAPIGPTYYN